MIRACAALITTVALAGCGDGGTNDNADAAAKESSGGTPAKSGEKLTIGVSRSGARRTATRRS